LGKTDSSSNKLSIYGKKRSERRDGTSGYNEELEIDATAKHLSTEMWSAYRFEIGPAPFRCFKPYYIAIETIAEPRRYVAGDIQESGDLQFVTKIRFEHAELFMLQREHDSKNCRYLRAFQNSGS
jgi:hypothetical protein